MNRIVFAAVAVLAVVTLILPSLTFAGNDGPSASGNFQFSLEDGQPRYLEFNAREQNKGTIVGEMTFSDPSVVPVGDPDSSDGSGTPGALVKAKFDCLKITGNRAVMGGVISESRMATCAQLATSASPHSDRCAVDPSPQGAG